MIGLLANALGRGRATAGQIIQKAATSQTWPTDLPWMGPAARRMLLRLHRNRKLAETFASVLASKRAERRKWQRRWDAEEAAMREAAP